MAAARFRWDFINTDCCTPLVRAVEWLCVEIDDLACRAAYRLPAQPYAPLTLEFASHLIIDIVQAFKTITIQDVANYRGQHMSLFACMDTVLCRSYHIPNAEAELSVLYHIIGLVIESEIYASLIASIIKQDLRAYIAGKCEESETTPVECFDLFADDMLNSVTVRYCLQKLFVAYDALIIDSAQPYSIVMYGVPGGKSWDPLSLFSKGLMTAWLPKDIAYVYSVLTYGLTIPPIDTNNDDDRRFPSKTAPACRFDMTMDQHQQAVADPLAKYPTCLEDAPAEMLGKVIASHWTFTQENLLQVTLLHNRAFLMDKLRLQGGIDVRHGAAAVLTAGFTEQIAKARPPYFGPGTESVPYWVLVAIVLVAGIEGTRIVFTEHLDAITPLIVAAAQDKALTKGVYLPRPYNIYISQTILKKVKPTETACTMKAIFASAIKDGVIALAQCPQTPLSTFIGVLNEHAAEGARMLAEFLCNPLALMLEYPTQKQQEETEDVSHVLTLPEFSQLLDAFRAQVGAMGSRELKRDYIDYLFVTRKVNRDVMTEATKPSLLNSYASNVVKQLCRLSLQQQCRTQVDRLNLDQLKSPLTTQMIPSTLANPLMCTNRLLLAATLQSEVFKRSSSSSSSQEKSRCSLQNDDDVTMTEPDNNSRCVELPYY